MYRLMPAEEKHISQVASLIKLTGYWRAGLEGNSLGLSSHDFICEFVAKPNLPFTTVAIKEGEEDKVLGMITCATKQELSQLADYDGLIAPRIKELFVNLFKFDLTESYHVSLLAVLPSARKQGIGRQLMEFAESKRQEKKINTLSLYTIGCQTSSIKFYIDMGMIITKVIPLAEALPFPTVLYFEKNAQLTKLQDYFETQSYQELDLLTI